MDNERGGSDFGLGLPHNDHETLMISYMNPVGYLFLVVLQNGYHVVKNSG